MTVLFIWFCCHTGWSGRDPSLKLCGESLSVLFAPFYNWMFNLIWKWGEKSKFEAWAIGPPRSSLDEPQLSEKSGMHKPLFHFCWKKAEHVCCFPVNITDTCILGWTHLCFRRITVCGTSPGLGVVLLKVWIHRSVLGDVGGASLLQTSVPCHLKERARIRSS